MADKLAIHGGTAVHSCALPYGKQEITEEDISSVTEVLRSDWLTTGPNVEAFEKEFAAATNSEFAVSVNSGTAALHCAAYASGVKAGDEVIIPTMTFLSTASVFVHLGARPVFADIEPDTMNIDPSILDKYLTPKTKAIVAVDFAGQPCAYDALKSFAVKNSLILVEDASHSLGASYHEQTVGSIADFTTFSLHPVKHITTGEGGMITTNDAEAASRMRQFRNHGINLDRKARENNVTWLYQIEDIGFNYRLTDFQCALGLSQLGRLSDYVKRRREIAAAYDEAFEQIPFVEPLEQQTGANSSHHIYVIKLTQALAGKRREIFEALRAEGIAVNVHYYPVHLQPYYKEKFGYEAGLCPVAEELYQRIISVPIFPKMGAEDIADVVNAIDKVAKFYSEQAS